jgi:hemerythrin-like domain-containing protein
MSMTTLEKLKLEHGEAALLMDLLEEQAHLGEHADVALICDIMHYMTHYPDLFHHRREDAVLRTLVQKYPDAMLWMPRLEQDHARLAAAGATLVERLHNPAMGDAERREIGTLAIEYATMLRAHMRFEEREFFPAAHAKLDVRDWEELETALPCPPDPLLGMGAESEYRSLETQYRSRLAWLIEEHRSG